MMTVNIQEKAESRVIEVNLTGRLTQDDYRRFEPEVQRAIEQHDGDLRILVDLRDFHGWSPSGLWEDIKFDVKHFNDVEKVALVGDKKWEKGMAVVCKPFTTAEVRFFDADEMDQGRTWVRAD
jgi:hypothetical protein